MAQVAQDTPQEFWRSPAGLAPADEATLPPPVPEMAEACADCGSEFMIGARFCHTCGRRRPAFASASADAAAMSGRWAHVVSAWARSVTVRSIPVLTTRARSIAAWWRKISFPDWVRYLHFHEIKRWIGLPTASLIAFMTGLGCVVGAIGVSLFYKAATLAEFQAVQLWRIEWLLAATASFVAGILLKKPSGADHD